jgi:hypothetical protein
VVDVWDYKMVLTSSLSTAWTLARKHIQVDQVRQKRQYDMRAKDHRFKVRDLHAVYCHWED